MTILPPIFDIVDDVPNFEHDCNDCHYIATIEINEGAHETINESPYSDGFDLYFCNDVISARYSDEPESYICWATEHINRLSLNHPCRIGRNLYVSQ